MASYNNNSPIVQSSSDDGSQICHEYISEINIQDKITHSNPDNNSLINNNSLNNNNNENTLSINNLSFDSLDAEHHDNEIDFDSNPRPWRVKRKRCRTSTNLEYSKIEEFAVNNEILHKKNPPQTISNQLFF